MTTELQGIQAELHRAVLDDKFMVEKAANQPDLPAREVSPEFRW